MLSEDVRMKLGTVLLVVVVGEFHGHAADSKLREFYLQWSWEFLLRLWREVLILDDLAVFALKQMLLLHQEAASQITETCCPSPPPPEDVHILSGEQVDSLLRSLVKCGLYTARARQAVHALPVTPGVNLRNFEAAVMAWVHEHQTSHQIEEAAESAPGEKPAQVSGNGKGTWRKWKIGLATIGGGAALALTGGLAAPFLAAGLSTIGAGVATLGPVGAVVGGALATTGAALGATGTVALFGAGGASLTGWKMTKRWGDLREFNFQGKEIQRSLDLTIGISGWLRDEHDEFSSHWKDGSEDCDWSVDLYLAWESANLRKLGGILYTLIRDEIAKSVTSVSLTAAFGAAATPLIWPVWVLNSLNDLDNSWLVCKDKAVLAGEELAEALISTTATCPVSLYGFSMGAVVIFEALNVLYDRGHFDKVSDVVLMGAPISSGFSLSLDANKRWCHARRVVSGRFVNVFSTKDWLLSLLARYLDWGIHIAGLAPLNRADLSIQDLAVDDLVSVHTDYPLQVSTILHSRIFPSTQPADCLITNLKLVALS